MIDPNSAQSWLGHAAQGPNIDPSYRQTTAIAAHRIAPVDRLADVKSWTAMMPAGEKLYLRALCAEIDLTVALLNRMLITLAREPGEVGSARSAIYTAGRLLTVLREEAPSPGVKAAAVRVAGELHKHYGNDLILTFYGVSHEETRETEQVAEELMRGPLPPPVLQSLEASLQDLRTQELQNLRPGSDPIGLATEAAHELTEELGVQAPITESVLKLALRFHVGALVMVAWLTERPGLNAPAFAQLAGVLRDYVRGSDFLRSTHYEITINDLPAVLEQNGEFSTILAAANHVGRGKR